MLHYLFFNFFSKLAVALLDLFAFLGCNFSCNFNWYLMHFDQISGTDGFRGILRVTQCLVCISRHHRQFLRTSINVKSLLYLRITFALLRLLRFLTCLLAKWLDNWFLLLFLDVRTDLHQSLVTPLLSFILHCDLFFVLRVLLMNLLRKLGLMTSSRF